MTAASVPPGEGHKSPQPCASRAGTGSAAYGPQDQWRGLYAGRSEDQKMVNAKALARLIEDRNRLASALEVVLDGVGAFTPDGWLANAEEIVAARAALGGDRG